VVSAIERVLDEGSLSLEIIINNKTLNNGLNVIQLETAVGAAMKSFEGGIGINVPRSRFLPVKKTSDLLLVMSNLYSLKNGSLVMSPQRMFPTTPLVKLGDNHFAKVKEFLGRFANIPDLIELDHLTVSGDVTFGRGVSLKVGCVLESITFHDELFSGYCNYNSQSRRSNRYSFRCQFRKQNSLR
jgi:UTP--glucose-1-phosphate uridylyltransferase